MKPLAVVLSVALLGSVGSLAQPAGAQTAQPQEIRFVDELPAPYHLTHVRMIVDGVARYDGPRQPRVLVPQGRHAVEITADYTLDDPVFSYVRHYRMRLRSSHVTTGIRSARPVVVTVAAEPRGGLTVPVDRRAVLAWAERP